MPEDNGATRGPVSVELLNERGDIESVETDILDRVDRFGYPKASRFAIKLAFEEAIANAFQHGHKALPGETPVLVTYDIGPDEVRIGIEDRGPGFAAEAVPDPTLDENLDRPSGRGLMLMKSYMSTVEYNERGNRVEMVYRRADHARN